MASLTLNSTADWANIFFVPQNFCYLLGIWIAVWTELNSMPYAAAKKVEINDK